MGLSDRAGVSPASLYLACPVHGTGHRRHLLYQDSRCECGRSLEPQCDDCDRTTCWCAKAGLLNG